MRKPKDWGQPCPNPQCTHYRGMQQGNVSAIATYLPQSGKRRIFRCHTCETPFSETRDTVFVDLRTSEDKVMMALKMLLVRVDLAGISVVLGVTAETVLAWLRRAAYQAEAINQHLLRTLPVTQGQLDEMWNFIGRKQAQETDMAGESLPDSADGRQWVAGIPAFFSDGFTCSLAALIAAFHVVTTFTRTGKRGRPRKPRCEPHPDLVYGQLVKQKQQGKLLTLSTRVVVGTERLTRLGLRLSTAGGERINLTLRQALAPLARKTSSFCKDRERLRQ